MRWRTCDSKAKESEADAKAIALSVLIHRRMVLSLAICILI
jgi:hypothetical protein